MWMSKHSADPTTLARLEAQEEEDSLASRSDALNISPDIHGSDDRGVILIEAISEDEILSP